MNRYIKDKAKRCRRCGIILDPLPHQGAEFCEKCFMGYKIEEFGIKYREEYEK